MKAEFPKAILHFDGDSFFASVEQVMDYRLRGKPVITGGERGAATALSYEAKRLGLYRGMTLGQIKALCPEAIIVPSNYVSYAIYANRMYSIVRSYTPIVEEYSIDECFADITGLDAQLGISYEEIALRIKKELEDSLGITFGVGLAPSKTLAKVASKAHKPAGFTSIPMSKIQEFLETLPIHSVWGLGGASGTHLTNAGAKTAWKFAQQTDAWLTSHRFGKAYRDIWLELNGYSVKPLMVEDRHQAGSIMTTRTFKPASKNKWFILSQLSKNVERACEKARKQGLEAQGLTFYLKTQDFTYHAVSMELTVPIANPSEIMRLIMERFDDVYAPGILYRATGITIRSLKAHEEYMPDLFGEREALGKRSQAFRVLDQLNTRYGKHTMFLASSLAAVLHTEAPSQHQRKVEVKKNAEFSVGIEKKHKTLKIPYLGLAH